MPTAEVGVVGSGSMGRGMALLYSEKGNTVHLYDVDFSATESVLKEAQETKNLDDKLIHIHKDLDGFMKDFSSGEARLIIFSLPHGKTTDKIIEQLIPNLKKGDIILDGGNEHYKSTERRQRYLKEKGVAFIGCGVSGGYQASRHGPSMSPGGDFEAYKKIEPLLKDWAAKDASGNACVEWVGKDGAGHYVKTLHNGIEQGELSVLAEAYSLLRNTLGCPNDEIQEIFKNWNEKGELSGNFLIDLGALIVGFTEGDGVKDKAGIVDDIEDKVTQDVDDSEGTGVWTVEESALRHISAPTIATAHYLRLISANKRDRKQTGKLLNTPQPSQLKDVKDKDKLIEQIRLATYGGFLCSFVQGLNILAKAGKEFGWDVPIDKCIKIWREGCIIKSGYIADSLQPIYAEDPKLLNLLTNEKICSELNKTYDALKTVVKLAIETDSVVPSISASLEYIKTAGDRDPTYFEEAQLDAFGDHHFDWRGRGRDDPVKGESHIEWRPT